MSNDIKDGGAAFPIANDLQRGSWDGMSLRDWFAGKAMQGLCGNGDFDADTVQNIAKAAYFIADAMIAAREAKP